MDEIHQHACQSLDQQGLMVSWGAGCMNSRHAYALAWCWSRRGSGKHQALLKAWEFRLQRVWCVLLIGALALTASIDTARMRMSICLLDRAAMSTAHTCSTCWAALDLYFTPHECKAFLCNNVCVWCAWHARFPGWTGGLQCDSVFCALCEAVCGLVGYGL